MRFEILETKKNSGYYNIFVATGRDFHNKEQRLGLFWLKLKNDIFEKEAIFDIEPLIKPHDFNLCPFKVIESKKSKNIFYVISIKSMIDCHLTILKIDKNSKEIKKIGKGVIENYHCPSEIWDFEVTRDASFWSIGSFGELKKSVINE